MVPALFEICSVRFYFRPFHELTQVSQDQTGWWYIFAHGRVFKATQKKILCDTHVQQVKKIPFWFTQKQRLLHTICLRHCDGTFGSLHRDFSTKMIQIPHEAKIGLLESLSIYVYVHRRITNDSTAFVYMSVCGPTPAPTWFPGSSHYFQELSFFAKYK